ncbi:MAG: PAS domain-containing protein [Anaerolineae bacterium]|nr:PAS domain-containing protein [Anaerolineae bacterium]
MLNLILTIAGMWGLAISMLALHRISPRYGLEPLLLLTAAITTLMELQWGTYIEPIPGLILFTSSNILLPVILMTIALLYIVDGSLITRITIYCVAGIATLAVVFLYFMSWQLSLPGGGSMRGFTPELLTATLSLRVPIGSFVALVVDMFMLTVFYQTLHNSHRFHEWFSAGVALLGALWVDAVVFSIIADLGTIRFMRDLPGEIVSKTMSGLLLWPLLGYYITRVVPRLPIHRDNEQRSAFDVFQGSLSQIKLALANTKSALEATEIERRNEETYFRQITENINEGIWLTSLDHNAAIYVNPAYEKLWGRKGTRMYGSFDAFAESLHPDDRERVLAGLGSQLDGNYSVEYRVVRPDQSVVWVRDRAFPIKNAHGEVYRVVGIVENITARKQVETHELALSVERERVRLLREFVSEASHDLRNPLGAIKLKLFGLRRVNSETQRKEILDELEQQVDRTTRLIDDLLTLTRLDNVRDLRLTKVSFSNIINDICTSSRVLMDKKGIQLELNVLHEDVLMRVDEADLARALANLIDNAVHYTTTNGTIAISVTRNGDELCIQIRDTGIGIPEADLPRVFDRFFRSDNARDIDPGGTGLGLAIVHKIIERHDGHIDVTSQEGHGTTFTILLGLVSAESEESV